MQKTLGISLVLGVWLGLGSLLAQSSPYPGKVSTWKGFQRYDFQFHPGNLNTREEHERFGTEGKGIPAHVVIPKTALPGTPWVWRARFPGWHTEMDSILLSEGFHLAFVNTDNRFGSPKAMEIWDAFYEYLTQQYDWSEKVSLEGVSRGGLFVYGWAKRNPEKVNCIYAEAPVCDFNSWPGGFGHGEGAPQAWTILKTEYGFSSDEEANAWDNQPMDNLQSLANAKVPILHMLGLKDEIVPPQENSFKLIDRYVKLGGSATIIPCTQGEQKLHGHHFPIETPQLGADFIRYHTPLSKDLLSSADYHQIRDGIRNSLLKFEREKEGRVAFLGGSITYNQGWRDSVMNYLLKRFPDTEFDFVAAGISSMGTTPAAFRLNRDVLSKGKIDLLFEEAAVNDATNERTRNEQVRAMEGIVRHLRAENPETDIVLMHFVDPDKMNTYRQGGIPKVVQHHEQVAAHYSIPTINLAREVTDRIDAGEFTWEDDFKNLHPSPFGQGVYARSMIAFLEQAWSAAMDNQKTPHALPEPIDADNYNKGELILAENAQARKGWTMIPIWKPADEKGTRPNYNQVPMMVGEGAGGILTFEFEGSAIGIAVAAGPDAGIIEYRIDGEPWLEQDLFTHWSMSLHLPWYYTLAVGLENEKHTLKIRLADEKNEQSVGQACRIRYFYVDK